MDRLHCSPGRNVGRDPARAFRRSVQNVRVDDPRSQMMKRTRERLLHLHRNWSGGVIWKSVVLSVAECELGLQEEIVWRHSAAGNGLCNSLADRGLIVMLALVRGVDAAKALPQSQLSQALSVALLPGCAVEQARNS